MGLGVGREGFEVGRSGVEVIVEDCDSDCGRQ